MTSPSDDQATPQPSQPQPPGTDQSTGSLAKRPIGFWVYASGGGFAAAILAMFWIAVHEVNRAVDINNLTVTGQYERVAAKADHDAILAVGSLCASEADKSAQTIKVADYLLTMASDTGTDQQSNGTVPPNPMSLESPSYILAAIVMSHHIAWARIALAEQERWTSFAMQIFQWCLVAIGAITTVLISIKAISNDRSASYYWIGIAAIIFSTLGTAVATLNSFYSPRVAHDHAERSLQALQALHLQLATGITREDHVCDKPAKWPTDWRFKRIKAIAGQYAAVMSAAQTPADTPEGGEPEDVLKPASGKDQSPGATTAAGLSTNGPSPR